MSKQVITLLGALVSIAVVALAVLLLALPVAGQAFAAQSATDREASANAAYEKQIAHLQAQKVRISEIEASVAALHDQIPAAPRLDEAFDIIARAAAGGRAEITSVTRGDLATFSARPAPLEAGPANAAEKKQQTQAQQTPVPTPAPTAGAPATDAQNSSSASAGDSTSAQTPAAAALAGPGMGSGRQQIPISLQVTAPDIASVQAFLEGLRAGPRQLAVDRIDVTPKNAGAGLDVKADLLVFIDTVSVTRGASK